MRDIRAGTVTCHYEGDVHSLKSLMKLRDKSYVLRIGTPSEWPWWRERKDGSGGRTDEDDGGDVDELSAPCVYVDPTNPKIKARYINDPLNPRACNVRFVTKPGEERANVVALRYIRAGEELFVSYGDRYWRDRMAEGSLVPMRLRNDKAEKLVEPKRLREVLAELQGS